MSWSRIVGQTFYVGRSHRPGGFNVGVEVMKTSSGVVMELPVAIVVEYVGGTMRMPLDEWRELVSIGTDVVDDAVRNFTAHQTLDEYLGSLRGKR